MVHIVGAGPGAPDLITVRGKELISQADTIIYAGSLVNPALLEYRKEGCRVLNSAYMTLEQVIEAIRETEMDALERLGISYEVCPGVSSFCGAAAALNMEYTLPEISQSVVITRMAGRTPVPERESVASFAAHGATMVLFLSSGLLTELAEELMRGGYGADTPAAIVYRATWEDEKKVLCTVGTLAERAAGEKITKTALIIVGNAVSQSGYALSKLYDPGFSTEYRQGSDSVGAEGQKEDEV